jgi:Tol biopolymer transport system component
MEFIKLAVAAYGNFDGAAASPDGTKIVYSIRGGLSQSGIWLIGADGRDVVKVQEASPVAYSFSWSPDGRHIAFMGDGLMVMDANGANLRTLGDFYIAQCYFLPPLWSPDSRMLAIVIDRGSEAFCQWGGDYIFEKTNILIIDVESGKGWLLLPDSEYGNIDPAWSPDGSRVAFVSNRSGNSEIWVVGIDGTDLHQLTNAQSYVRFPYWRKP